MTRRKLFAAVAAAFTPMAGTAAGFAGRSNLTANQMADLKFAAGDQWEPHILEDRKAHGRPTLVVNMIPGLVNRYMKSRRINDGRRIETILLLVPRLRELQRMHNYVYSALVEEQSALKYKVVAGCCMSNPCVCGEVQRWRDSDDGRRVLAKTAEPRDSGLIAEPVAEICRRMLRESVENMRQVIGV